MEESQVKRKQKVYYQYYQKSPRGEFYPMIRIAGKYLRQFNFDIGDEIEVDVSSDHIQIRKVKLENIS